MEPIKKRILVVDDEHSVTRLLKLCLEESDRFVVKAENAGKHALAAAREFQPDLILLDVMMPDVDGGMLASQFREDPRFKDVPIVFLTALATPGEVHEHGGLIGGSPFLAKPVDIPDVIACVDKQLAA